jgi:gamma-glutamyl phosphate reductase
MTKDSGSVFSTSNKAKIVSTSSTDSEIIALYEATKVAIWIRGFLKDLHYGQTEPTIIYQDNKSVIQLMDNVNNETNTKHLLEKINYIRQEIELNVITLIYMPTEEMVADIMTKPLPQEPFFKFREIMMDGHHWIINDIKETI